MSKPEERYRTVTASLDEALERAISSHVNGDLDYAKYVCQRILQVDPTNAVARHHLRIVEDWRSMPVMIRNLVAPHVRAQNAVILDVGAHTGLTVSAYREAFPTATIHAFEPDPDLAAQLAAKVANDPLTVVNVQAVGPAPGRQRFNVCRAGANDAIGSFLDLNPDNEVVQNLGAERARSLEVEVTSIDAYCQEHGIEQVDFVKLDVQGYEDQCLLGAARMLERQSIGLLQVELLLGDMYARTLSFYDIEKLLIPAGYRLYAIDDVHPRFGAELFQLDAFYVPRTAKPTP